MFKEIDEIRKDRKRFNSEMFRSGVGTFRELETFEANAFRGGALEQKHKELIALGISICRACYGCIEYHVSKAVALGASRKEILEATAVALALGGGLAQWPARFVFKVLGGLEKKDSVDETKSKS